LYTQFEVILFIFYKQGQKIKQWGFVYIMILMVLLYGENVFRKNQNIFSNCAQISGFEICTPVVMKNSVCLEIMPCSLVKVDLGAELATCFLLSLFFDPEDGDDKFVRKFGSVPSILYNMVQIGHS
jgi:hypothetical protein